MVPAAGVGSRMGASIPKQYLPLAGQPVIAHTLARLCAFRPLSRVVVALAGNDDWWPDAGFSDNDRVVTVAGGAERCHSVLNALDYLAGVGDADDWVLVHDAARPCLREQDLQRLITDLHGEGALLAVPIHDTVKRADEHRQSAATVDRSRLWRALTPQIFRLAMLRAALIKALDDNVVVTDEASAIEYAGGRPKLIEGHSDNIKITRPEDLALAAFHLQQQAVEHAHR